MANKTLGNSVSNQTIDLSAGLGYGLIYQPVLGSNIPSEYPFAYQMLSLHRRAMHRQFRDKRR